jgi:hypothetical protein
MLYAFLFFVLFIHVSDERLHVLDNIEDRMILDQTKQNMFRAGDVAHLKM